MDSELIRAWQLVNELSEQLALNQSVTETLQLQAKTLKFVQNNATDTGAHFNLRRFNVDLGQECFESELERTNAQVIIENQNLLRENKQLSTLLREYESAMETILAKFRSHTLAAQQHEVTLKRHYETLLHARENYAGMSDLAGSPATAASIYRLSQYLRALLRSLSGKDTAQFFSSPALSLGPDPSAPVLLEQEIQNGSSSPSEPEKPSECASASAGPSNSGGNNNNDGETDAPPPELDWDWDWAAERENEIVRLEAENVAMRAHLGLDDAIALEIDPSSLSSSSHEPPRGYASTFVASTLPFSMPQPLGGSMGEHGMSHHQHHGSASLGGMPLQRGIDMPMRSSPSGGSSFGGGAPRRTAMFSGRSVAGRGIQTWAPAPPQPAPPHADRSSWPVQGAAIGLDLGQ